jgi:hypothetical protein
MGFGLMTRFITHFDTVHDYSLQFTISLSLPLSLTHTLSFSLSSVQSRPHCCCLVMASNSEVPLPLGSQIAPGLSYQLLTATAHND